MPREGKKISLRVSIQPDLPDLFDLQAEDDGEYQCVAESEAGTTEKNITLKVQGEFYVQNEIQCNGMQNKLEEYTHILTHILRLSMGPFCFWFHFMK